MASTRRTTSATVETNSGNGNGPMASFGGLRNWIFGVLVSLLAFAGGIGIADVRGQIAKLQTQTESLRDRHDRDLTELRERWNSEYQGLIQRQGENGERLGKLETELRTTHSEIMSRLDRIEAKLNK